MNVKIEAKGHIYIAICLIILSVLSLWIVYRGASIEPFLFFRNRDAVIQIGVATSLIVLWIQLCLFIIINILSKRLNCLWSGFVIWTIIVVFYIIDCISGYLEDIAILGSRPPGG